MNSEAFYRGGQDHNKMAAPNGAIVNGDFLRFAAKTQSRMQVHQVCEGLRVITGYHSVNCIVVEGLTGLIVIETGTKFGHGRDLRAIIRGFSDKPVKALIYSHHHYIGGAAGLLDGERIEDIQVFAHPLTEPLAATTSNMLGPMQLRRIGIQFGAYLPDRGPDARLGKGEKSFDDPHLNAFAPLAVTHAVADGESITVDGVNMRFHHIIGDTRDSLAIEFPDLDAVVANSALAPMAYPMYTLRGDFFRTPDELIDALDLLRDLDYTYVIPVHGNPYLDRASAQAALTAHRDAYAFIWNQCLRAINRGMTPDEMVASIRLPEHLLNDPVLYPGYVDWEYGIRGIYRGLVGWYSEDGADLHPPARGELGGVLVEGFGGASAFLDRARTSMDERKYNLAASLASLLMAAEPGNEAARQLKADALRAMAQSTRTGIQTRNFMLTEALHLEGKTDWHIPSAHSFFGAPSVDSLMQRPPQEQVKLLEQRVDANAAAALRANVAFRFDGHGECGLLLRPSVAEFRSEAPAHADVTFSLDARTMARLSLRETGLAEAIEAGDVRVSGNETLISTIEKALTLASSAVSSER
ncbi:alkyl sulfatase dimerization domain-containing protein [Caballeronia cordobensis]|uniref:alkyl sulfatase dimerization domain-containing protein n=1 Tax=Caballeronia cordobensis TaxID=1353886 RepID=UPI00045F0241|nr:beta-lactamase domain-containing protein [Burkholderia sp. RPE67]